MPGPAMRHKQIWRGVDGANKSNFHSIGALQ
jgi:hypothetical protein